MRTIHSAVILCVEARAGCEISFNEDDLKGEENVSGLGDLGTTADLPVPQLSYNFKVQLSLLPDMPTAAGL